ncbi:MAG: response regulator [Chloroflexota bacterium]
MGPQKAKILIVDDEKGMRDLLSFMLRTEGYDVVEVTNGQEAMEQMVADEFDVTIADLMMPSMDGLNLLRHIRARDEEMVVIVMTAYASLQTAIEAMKFGAYDYLIKPFDDVEKVMNTIGRAVERRRLTRRNNRLLEDLREANRRLGDMVAESQERTARLQEAYNALKTSDQLKSQFLASISQDLRTPLALVKGYATLMTERLLGKITEEQGRALEVINDRTDNLIQVVDDLIFLRDAEIGRAYLCLETVALSGLVQRLCQRMAPRARRKSIRLRIQNRTNGHETAPVIQADPLRLEQGLGRLLDDAIRCGRAGSHITLTLSTTEEYIELTIHYQGSRGMVEKLGWPGLDRSHEGRRQHKGSDSYLGLSLARAIAELHGGDVTAAIDADAWVSLQLSLPLENKGRLLNQSMALSGDLADEFRLAIGVFPASRPAWQTI